MNYEWTPIEEHLLQSEYGKVSMERLEQMLPRRTRGAIIARAKTLGLQEKQVVNTQARSIEAMEAEIAVRRAQLDVEQADQGLNLFDEQMIQSYNSDKKPQEYVKQFSTQRSKLTAKLSQSRLKLAMARMAQKSL